MFFWISLFGIIYVTNLNVCWCLCNLSRLNSSSTSQSSVYIYKNESPKVHLKAERAIDGKYLKHIEGECAGTDQTNGSAWWTISLPALANIFKINLMFRENFTRHFNYQVFINKEVVDISKLDGMAPLYQEKERNASSQFIMIFPFGIKGKQLVIYRNKELEDGNPENMLDICEVEIWGCIDLIDEANCTCSQDKNFTFVKQESLTSVVAWPFQPNNVTLNCHQGNVTLQYYEDQCEFKPKCDLEYWNKSILFFCSACTEAIYDSDTTYDQNTRPFYTLSVGDNVTYTCKKGHRLTGGNLTRICQENGSWSGEEPNCKRCKCPCKRLASQNFIKDPIVLRERVEETKKILKVNRSELSAFKRRKISSHDGRTSSTGLGMTLGVGVITFVIGTIVCSDFLTWKGQSRVFRKTL